MKTFMKICDGIEKFWVVIMYVGLFGSTLVVALSAVALLFLAYLAWSI